MLRAEFGTHGLSLRGPRGTVRFRYAELLPVQAGRRAVVLRLRRQPALAYARPRELFPEAALDLIEPRAKVRRHG